MMTDNMTCNERRDGMQDRKASLLMIYTGGTIGMKQDPADLTLKPFNFEHILMEVPVLHKFAYRIDSV